MKNFRFLSIVFSVSAFVFLKGDGCGGEARSVSKVSCTDDGRLSLDIAPGECLALEQACAPGGASNSVYASSEYTLSPRWSDEDWLSLQENESGEYMLCAAAEAELGRSVRVGIGVETNGIVMVAAKTLDVDVNVLGWDLELETPSLTDHYLEPGMEFRVQSIVLGRSGIVSFDFEMERVSTAPCGHVVEAPDSPAARVQFHNKDSEQYWATVVVQQDVQPGCYRLYATVTPSGSSTGREKFKELSVRPALQAVIDTDLAEFVAYSTDVALDSSNSTPRNGSRQWKVSFRGTPSSMWEDVEHHMEAGGTRFVISYILAGTYRLSLTVADPSNPNVTDTAEMEISVAF
jgi:hypothetical protein